MTIAQDMEIRRLTRELDELRLQHQLAPFTRTLADKLAFIMACRHPDEWTEVERAAFTAARRNMPACAGLWYERVVACHPRVVALVPEGC